MAARQLWCATPHHTKQHHTTPHHTKQHHTKQHHTKQHHTTPQQATPPHHTTPQQATPPHHTTPHQATPPHHTTPHHSKQHHHTTPHHSPARLPCLPCLFCLKFRIVLRFFLWILHPSSLLLVACAFVCLCLLRQSVITNFCAFLIAPLFFSFSNFFRLDLRAHPPDPPLRFRR